MKWSVNDVVAIGCIIALSILTATIYLISEPRMDWASAAGVASIGPLLGLGLVSVKRDFRRAHILSCMLWFTLAVFLFIFLGAAGAGI